MLRCSMRFKPTTCRSHENFAFAPSGAMEPPMADSFSPQHLPANKTARYRSLLEEIVAVLAGESDVVARMATVSSMLAAAFPDFLWTGFYRVDPSGSDWLVVGPYQGSLGC